MKRLSLALFLAAISANGIAQPPSAQRDPVLNQEKAIAVEVELTSEYVREQPSISWGTFGGIGTECQIEHSGKQTLNATAPDRGPDSKSLEL